MASAPTPGIAIDSKLGPKGGLTPHRLLTDLSQTQERQIRADEISLVSSGVSAWRNVCWHRFDFASPPVAPAVCQLATSHRAFGPSRHTSLCG